MKKVSLRVLFVAMVVFSCMGFISFAAQESVPQIIVSPSDTVRYIEPELFGSILVWISDGEGSFNPETGDWDQKFMQYCKEIGTTSIRYGGGTISATAFDWKRTLGPIAKRPMNRARDGNVGQPSNCGVDEWGRLLDYTGAKGILIYNFARGNIQDGLNYLAYMIHPSNGADVDDSDEAKQSNDPQYWGNLRAKYGHPEPYNVNWFDVGNEEEMGNAEGWRSGTVVSVGAHTTTSELDTNQKAALYAFGGTTAFTKQAAVGYADLDTAASYSDGTNTKRFFASYPPVVGGSDQLYVANGSEEEQWTRVSNLAAAEPGAKVYTIDNTTGEIKFGDGTNHGAIPPSGYQIKISYQSGPHEGYVDYYRAIKAYNPNIKVSTQHSGEAFMQVMGSTYPMDGFTNHPLSLGWPSNRLKPLREFLLQEFTTPVTQQIQMDALQKKVDSYAGTHVPLLLSAYGRGQKNQPSDDTGATFKDEHLCLNQGLAQADQLIAYQNIGITLAHRFLLGAMSWNPGSPDFPGDPTNCWISNSTTGTDSCISAIGLSCKLMSPLAGMNQIGATVQNNPVIDLADGAAFDTIDTLNMIAAKDDSANVTLLVVNHDPDNDIKARVVMQDYNHSAVATVSTLNGPDPVSVNTLENPNTVNITTKDVYVGTGDFDYTFSAHSVTRIVLVKGTTTYGIASIPNQSFTTLTAGYAADAPETKSITITRTGKGVLTNLAAALSGTNAASFIITQPAVTTLDKATSSTTFTVKAKNGLAAETYTATVTITADNLSPVSFTVTQQVNNADLTSVATPVISPNGGTYNSQWVTITCATKGAKIYYSTDGSDPISSSALYSGPIALATGTTTVKAKAFNDVRNPSAIASQTYTIAGTVNKYQTGSENTSITLKTAQNYANDLSVQYDTASLWAGKGKSGKISDLWLYYPQLIGSGSGQVPAGSGIVSAQLVLTVKGFKGNAYQPHKLNLYRIDDPDNLGTPYFGSDGIKNGLDHQYRDHRLGKNTPWKIGAADIGSLLAESVPADSCELIPASFTEEGYTKIRFNVTDAVQAWADGIPNQGWFLSGAAAAWAHEDGVEFYGSGAANVANRPKLEVNYVAAGADNAGPEKVQNLTSTPGDGQVSLVWTNPSYDFAGAVVLRKAGIIPADPTDGTVIYDGTANSWPDRNVTNDKTYYYAVFAYDSLRNYSQKSWVKAIPTAGAGTPAAPSGLSVSASGTKITFNWRDNSGNEKYFQLEQQKGSAGAWQTIACADAGVQSFVTEVTDVNLALEPGAVYNYRISAVNATGASDYSTTSWTANAFLQAPSNLTWTIVSADRVDLNWTGSTGATGYRIDVCRNDGTVLWSVNNLAANAVTCPVTRLQAGMEYLLKVVAIRGGEAAATVTEVIKTTADFKGGLL